MKQEVLTESDIQLYKTTYKILLIRLAEIIKILTKADLKKYKDWTIPLFKIESFEFVIKNEERLIILRSSADIAWDNADDGEQFICSTIPESYLFLSDKEIFYLESKELIYPDNPNIDYQYYDGLAEFKTSGIITFSNIDNYKSSFSKIKERLTEIIQLVSYLDRELFGEWFWHKTKVEVFLFEKYPSSFLPEIILYSSKWEEWDESEDIEDLFDFASVLEHYLQLTNKEIEADVLRKLKRYQSVNDSDNRPFIDEEDKILKSFENGTQELYGF